MMAAAVGMILVAVMIGSASAAKQPGRTPVKFGYKLTTNTQPSNSVPPHKCADVDPENGDLADAPCTRMQFSASAATGGNKAPTAGTITNISVIACKDG